MTVRVYVPSTASRLRAARESGELGPAPVQAHAVTAAVRKELDEEDGEYAAASAAALASVRLLTDEDPPRRVVVALDVPRVRDVQREDPTVVHVEEVVPWRWVAAVLVDDGDAERAVRAARADAGALDRCLDHELGWWAAQEVPGLLADLGTAQRP